MSPRSPIVMGGARTGMSYGSTDMDYLVVDRKSRIVSRHGCILPAMDSMRSWGTGARVIRPDGTVLAVMVAASGGKTRNQTRLAMEDCVVAAGDPDEGDLPRPRVLH